MRTALTCRMIGIFFLLSLSSLSVFGQFIHPLDTVRARAARQGLWFPAENKNINQIFALMRNDGSFTDRGPDLYILEKRIRKMAQAYYSDPAWQGNNKLKNAIYDALTYWFDHAQPGSRSWGDWTRTDLAMPRWLGLTTCLMYDAIDVDIPSDPRAVGIKNDVEKYYRKYVWNQTLNRPGTKLGANLSSRLVGAISLAAFLDDHTKASAARDTASSVLTRGAGTQTQVLGYPHTGLTTDYSLHQHNSQGGQNLWGNYGMVYLTDLTFYCELVGGSQWDLSPAEYQEIYKAVKEGAQFFAYRGSMSLSVAGRIVLNPNRYGDAGRLGNVLRELARRAGISNHGFTKAQADELMDMRIKYLDPSKPGFVDTSKYFFTSDMIVHARPDNHLVVRMLSRRSGANELGIGYPTQNYHLTDGSTFFMLHGKEYDEARLGMNFTAFPGITCEQKSGRPTQAGKNTMNSDNEFAGGLSDGRLSVGGFEYDRTHAYNSTTARKGYFIFEDIFAFLGSKVEQQARPNGEIWTTLNQAERRGVLTYDLGGGQRSIALNANIQQDFNNLTSTAWFHHDGMGYIILPNGGVDLKLWAERRRERWKNIDASNKDNSLKTVNMFQLSISHGRNPARDRYQYLVLPNVSAIQTERLAANLPLRIIKHTDDAQVIFHQGEGTSQAILYAPNQSFDTQLGTDMAADKPAVIMCKADSNFFYVSLSDPLQKNTKIKLTLNGQFSGPRTTYQSASNTTEVDIDFPQGIQKGERVDVALRKENSGSFLPVELLDFHGTYEVEAGQVLLTWATASELNFSHFEVLKSGDGMAFQRLSQVASQGNSSSTQTYQIYDSDPLPGSNYYRLRMVDVDGSSSLSSTIELRTERSLDVGLKVYPNPTTSGLPWRVEIQSKPLSKLEGRLVDPEGRLVKKIDIVLDSDGQGREVILGTGLGPGIYLLIIGDRKGSFRKFQKLMLR